MANAWSHDEAFPIVARLIRAEFLLRNNYVPSTAIARLLQSDHAGKLLIQSSLAREDGKKTPRSIAQNMVDWFSARFDTSGFEWARQFTRVKQDRVWAYKPLDVTLPFVVGDTYSKSDIYRIATVPVPKQRGNWDTGYTKWRGDWYIFCNVGAPGRTGHDYANKFVGDELHWFGKTRSHVRQDSIVSMLDPASIIYVFYRENDRAPFVFAGRGRARLRTSNTVPVELTFSFDDSADQRPEFLPEEVANRATYVEGATRTITVNVFERNPQARKNCIRAHGIACTICGFDFASRYGEIGKGFIHVHHLKPLGEIRAEYQLDAIKDLRPVCPNCHAMLHRRTPPYSIEEMRQIYRGA